MNFFNSTRLEPQPGTAAYAQELADACRDIEGLGPTDAMIIEAALRSRATCRLRRATVAFITAAMIAITLMTGMADRNNDGRVDLADLVLGVKAAFVTPIMTGQGR